MWFKLFHGVGTTEENLLDAAAGENYEWTDMYKQMAETAREEGFNDIAPVRRRIFPNISRFKVLKFDLNRFQSRSLKIGNDRRRIHIRRDRSVRCPPHPGFDSVAGIIRARGKERRDRETFNHGEIT